MSYARRPMSLLSRLLQINWSVVLLVMTIAVAGFFMLYSAAGGNYQPWAASQMLRFSVGFVLMIGIALLPITWLMRGAYVVYFGALGLLVMVEVSGFIGMGAQRWVNLGGVNLQPSEAMKIALILALARYFHGLHDDQIGRAPFVMGAALMIAIPALFILRQPNLGTATILMVMGATVMFMAGVHRKYFMFVALMVFSLAPLGWSMLHAYQKQRVLTFLDPEADPLGSGYNIIQSKIAIGSGGFFGKGYLQGSQGQLDFLPEKQTDFIFTMLAEEFGFIGSVGLLLVYLLLLIYGLAISVRSKHRFGALIGVGFTTLLFLHLFINVAMVMGMLPVVGVPLPLMSYGGSMMLTVLAGFGLLLNVYVNRDQSLGRAVGNRI